MQTTSAARRSGPKWTSSRLPQVEMPRGDTHRSRVVSLYSARQGVGKTTLGVNLAAYLSAAMPVTFIDADPRGPGARWLRDGRHVRPDLVVLYSPSPTSAVQNDFGWESASFVAQVTEPARGISGK
ncbi:MAG: hypothetical protein ABIT01_17900 [Thermoanaerobaculia bacterium]